MAAAVPLLGERTAHGAAKPTAAEGQAIEAIAREVMNANHAPGLSVAFAKDGELVYAQGFGVANQESGEKVTPAHRFRIASVSKPFTSVTIHTLIEQGKLKLEDKVFGVKGLLGLDLPAASPEVVNITLHHLLTHTGGGWSNKSNDPMFQNPGMNQANLIAWTVRNRPLESPPGQAYAYSNFGYCVLGRVIEKVTGVSYVEAVTQRVLAPCGISDMQIAGNMSTERVANEVVYYGQNGEQPYKPNVRRMDSHGGWIATPTALVRFLTRVDGFPTVPDLLRAETIQSMTTPTAANPSYACGFAVNRVPNWWHAGSLPGTLSILVRTASGLCWAAVANTRAEGLNLDRMMWQMARVVPAWRA
jgi:CubicO group peptidase (beta-lactamase class C family)